MHSATPNRIFTAAVRWGLLNAEDVASIASIYSLGFPSSVLRVDVFHAVTDVGQ